MGHGLGAVKVGGLASFAERFCREGFAAVVIDYRQWGGSEGQQPRDELNVPRQREDYSAAIGWAAAQPNIDEHRIFVWGTSFAGMHATALAASDHRLAGAIAQCPLVDGLAGSRLVRPSRSLALFATAIIDRLGSLVGRAPIYLPVNVAPGEWGIADTSDALFGKKVMHPREPVDWHNRMAARSLLSIPAHRPVRHARDINIPILLIVAESRHAGTGRSRTRRGRSRTPSRTSPQQGRPLRRLRRRNRLRRRHRVGSRVPPPPCPHPAVRAVNTLGARATPNP